MEVMYWSMGRGEGEGGASLPRSLRSAMVSMARVGM